MLIKICGIQTKEVAVEAANAGADLIGFVFAPSKRRISPFQAAKIAYHLPKPIKKVGVFVDEPVEKIIDIAKTVDLDYIQLHGKEEPSLAQSLPYKIMKAFPINEVTDSIRSYPCSYYLIDSASSDFRGGSGKTFDWDKINHLSIDKNKLILAGGLSPENIDLAIKTVKPAGIDVSSGVETNGEKDLSKIRAFIHNARKAAKMD